MQSQHYVLWEACPNHPNLNCVAIRATGVPKAHLQWQHSSPCAAQLHVVVSGNTQWIETRNATEHPAMHRTDPAARN